MVNEISLFCWIYHRKCYNLQIGQPVALIYYIFQFSVTFVGCVRFYQFLPLARIFVHRQYVISFVSDVYRAVRTSGGGECSNWQIRDIFAFIAVISTPHFTNSKNKLIFPLLHKFCIYPNYACKCLEWILLLTAIVRTMSICGNFGPIMLTSLKRMDNGLYVCEAGETN